MSQRALPFITLCAALSLGCQGTTVDDDGDTTLSEEAYRAALPDADQLMIDMPGAQAKATAEVGEDSEFANLSKSVARGANNTVYNVLTMIDTITDYPSRVIDEETRAWGPFTPEGSAVTQLFVMQLQEDGDLGYTLKWKPAGAEDAAFVTVVNGLIYGGYDVYKNVGSFRLDYDVAATLNAGIQAQGTAQYDYNTASPNRQIQGHLKDVFEVDGRPVDARLAYVKYAEGGGELGFGTALQFYPDDAGKLEVGAVHTRWVEGGAGRSDVTITGGGLGEDIVNISECWGADFIADYEEAFINGEELGASGDSDLCTYEDAEYPPLGE